MKSKKTRQNPPQERVPDTPQEVILTFRQHLRELRRRIIYIACSIGVWSVVTYAFERQTVDALLRPAKRQQFIYTSPIGGVDFMFRVSLYVAFILTLPVIVYNVLAFTQPMLTRNSRRFIAFGSIASGVLAACGLAFGYFIGLPSAMHFLLHQFVTSQIKPLLTIQSYLSFVVVYMLGSALMLQIPLILIFINRIKPLKPQRLLHHERWVILGSFAMSAIMNPTPNVIDLLLVAGPLIVMYQVGILIIAFMNHSKEQPKIEPESPPVGAPRQYIEPVQVTPRAAAMARPAVRRSYDVVSRRPAAQPLNRRPLFGAEQQLYLRRKLDEKAAM